MRRRSTYREVSPAADSEAPTIVAAHQHVHMPPLRSMFRNIGGQVLESTLVPAAIFGGMFHLTGLTWALLSGLAWCYLAVARRWFRGGALPAVLIVGTVLFTTRTGVALAFHSAFAYLLTPTINAFVLAAVFTASVLMRRPLAERFAKDFVGLSPEVTAARRVQATLRHLSMIWALMNMVNGVVALQLLMSNHIDAVLMARSLLAPALTGCAVASCFVLGRRTLKAEGVHLHLRWRDPEPVAA